jgi:SAM-dependent methyltransferase
MMIPALARHVDTLYLCDEQLAPARATSRWFEATNVVCLPPDELDSRIGDSSLDVIIAADVLEHVEDLPTVIATLRRKLRSGAALIASGPTESIAYRCGRWVAGFSGEYHLRDVFDVEDALRRAPFARRQLRRLPFSMTPAFFRITSWRRLD